MKAHRDEHVKLCENLCRAAFPMISRKQITQCNPGKKRDSLKNMRLLLKQYSLKNTDLSEKRIATV